jgi:hypothetical protein
MMQILRTGINRLKACVVNESAKSVSSADAFDFIHCPTPTSENEAVAARRNEKSLSPRECGERLRFEIATVVDCLYFGFVE